MRALKENDAYITDHLSCCYLLGVAETKTLPNVRFSTCWTSLTWGISIHTGIREIIGFSVRTLMEECIMVEAYTHGQAGRAKLHFLLAYKKLSNKPHLREGDISVVGVPQV